MSYADPNTPSKIVVLTAGGPLARIVVNGLGARLGSLTVIEEQPETKAQILRRRARLLGWSAALSQAAAGLAIRALAKKRSARVAEIVHDHGLDLGVHADMAVLRVASVNAPETLDLLAKLKPDVVAVYGTRILKPATLKAVAAPFINYHAGINPKYRGQHPGYWALANGDAENAGVTIHLVDEGVDTGSVLYQARCAFEPADTISSYQFVQAARALPLFANAIEDALNGRLKPRHVALPSKQWFPPTLGRYLTTGLVRGVW
jgi:methionyl-tRNA formyltransferase